MGMDCYALTIIGLKILKNAIRVTDRVKIHDICNCSINKPDYKFCPACGRENVPEYDDVERYADYICPIYPGTPKYIETVHDISIQLNGRNYEIIETCFDCNYYYVPIYLGKKNGPRNYDEKQIIKCQKTLSELLEEEKIFIEDMKTINLWDEKNYGIFTDIRISY